MFDSTYFLIQGGIPFFGVLGILDNLSPSLANVHIQVWYHTLNIGPEMVNVVVLYFHLSRDSFFERRDIFKDLTTLFHSQVKNFKLVLYILIFFLNLSTELFNQFWMFHKFLIHCRKHSSLKDFGIIGNHKWNLFDSQFIFSLVRFYFVDKCWWFENTLLDGSQDLLNNLTDFGLHLKPLEFLDFEFKVLGHVAQSILKAK